MWHSEADIINDLAALNDFGEPENTEPYKILCSIGRGSKAEKKPQPKTLLDPRTGEDIELGGHCLNVEDMLCRGKGRGSVLGTRSYNLLHRQLRLARPLGSGDEIIESYCKRNNSPEQAEASPDLSDFESTSAFDKSFAASSPGSSSKMKSRVKAVRNSNLLNNALISSLLKAKEIALLNPETEKLNIPNKTEILDNRYKDCPFDFDNGELLKNRISQVDLCSDNSFIIANIENGPSKSSNREEMLEKIKLMGDKSCKSLSTDLSKDFNSDLSFNIEDEEVQNILKKDSDPRITSDYVGAEQNLDRNEMYKKLGERMNKMNLLKNQRKKEESCISEKNPEPENKNLGTQNFQSYQNEYVYDKLHFPPLV